jgi:hypothetical protein
MNAWPGTSCDRRVRAWVWVGNWCWFCWPDCAGRLSRYQRSLEANHDYAAAGASEQHGFANG